MTIHRIPGVVLNTIPQKEYDILFTLFTPAGLMKFYAKGGSGNRRGLKSLLTPLTEAEIVFKESVREIHTCLEGSPLNIHLSLRERLDNLQAAGDMVQAILASQWLGKPAPDLYNLLVYSLNKIPQARDPWVLAMSFRLKILRHDGLWDFDIPEPLWHGITAEEQQLTIRLATSRVWSELKELQLSPQIRESITQFFRQLLA